MSTYLVYMSGVSGSVISIKDLQRMKIVLDAKKIKYTEIDISLDENSDAKANMKAKSKSPTPLQTPQIFTAEGEFLCDYKTFEEWNEYEELAQHFK